MPSVRFRVDGAGKLAQFAKDLKAADPELRRMLTVELKKAAEPVAAKVRQEASAHGLSRAAGAVSVQFRASGRRAGVTIAVNSKKAPYARPLDVGSQGRTAGATGAGGVNRHPVFAAVGSDAYENGKRWVNQPTRPFFQKAIYEASPKVGQALVDAMGRVAKAAGFH